MSTPTCGRNPYRDRSCFETGSCLVMKYRDTVLALAVEMWRPLGFCSLRSGCQNMIMILGFGDLITLCSRHSAFCCMIAAGDTEPGLQEQRVFTRRAPRGLPTGWGIVDFHCYFTFWVILTSMYPHRLDFFRTPMGVRGLLWFHFGFFFANYQIYSGFYCCLFWEILVAFYIGWIVKCAACVVWIL